MNPTLAQLTGVRALMFPAQPHPQAAFCPTHRCPLILTSRWPGQHRWRCVFETLNQWLGLQRIAQVLSTDTGHLALLVFANGYALAPLCPLCGERDLACPTPLSGRQLEAIAWPPEELHPNVAFSLTDQTGTAPVRLDLHWRSLSTLHHLRQSPALWSRRTDEPANNWEAS